MENFIREQKKRINEARKSSVYKKSAKFRKSTEKAATSLEHFAYAMMNGEDYTTPFST